MHVFMCMNRKTSGIHLMRGGRAIYGCTHVSKSNSQRATLVPAELLSPTRPNYFRRHCRATSPSRGHQDFFLRLGSPWTKPYKIQTPRPAPKISSKPSAHRFGDGLKTPPGAGQADPTAESKASQSKDLVPADVGVGEGRSSSVPVRGESKQVRYLR